jgi:hypothetical protein
LGRLRDASQFPNSRSVSPRRQVWRGEMDTDGKDEKPTDFELEIAVFGAA